MFSLRSIATNPRDLDKTIICPMCANDTDKVLASKKRPNYHLSHLVAESVRPVATTRRDLPTQKYDVGDNPLGFHFDGCKPDRRIDSLMSGAGDAKAAKIRPRVSVMEQKTLKVLLLSMAEEYR